MDFLRQAVTASILVALTLAMQSAGMGALIRWGRAQFKRELHRLGAFRSAELIVRCMSVMIAFHLLQILLWASFYRWNCFPSWENAFYFSAASFSTVGYGDLVLPQSWRTLGPVESVAGVLMCGLSASFLFAIVNRLVQREQLVQLEPAMPVTQIDSSPASRAR
jgi:voltage-gated potassium channel